MRWHRLFSLLFISIFLSNVARAASDEWPQLVAGGTTTPSASSSTDYSNYVPSLGGGTPTSTGGGTNTVNLVPQTPVNYMQNTTNNNAASLAAATEQCKASGNNQNLGVCLCESSSQFNQDQTELTKCKTAASVGIQAGSDPCYDQNPLVTMVCRRILDGSLTAQSIAAIMETWRNSSGAIFPPFSKQDGGSILTGTGQ